MQRVKAAGDQSGDASHPRGTGIEDLEASLKYMDTIGDKWAIARSLSGLGDTFFHLKDLEQAKSAYQRSISHWNELGNIRGIQLCLARLARVAIAEDRISEAVTFYVRLPILCK